MNTIRIESRVELIEKKSKFIGLAFSCQTLERVRELQEALRQEFSDASHVAFAYRIRQAGALVMRFGDDGEVTGTAGKPIFRHIEGRELVDVAVFVVRYYGGINLGAGGLSRAYGGSAKMALDEAGVTEVVDLVRFSVSLGYDRQNQLEWLLGKHHGRIVSRTFAEAVQCEIEMPDVEREAFVTAWEGR